MAHISQRSVIRLVHFPFAVGDIAYSKYPPKAEGQMHSEIRPLTGLRGIAALYVAVHHFHWMDASSLSHLIRHGYLAVDLFFVLSGFVLAMNYGKAFQNGFSWQSYVAFLTKRIARIYPLYLFFTMILAVVLVLWGGARIFGSDFLLLLTANTLMIQTWGIAPSIVSPGWSLSAEWAAYLLFPALTCCLLYGRRAVAVTGAMFCLVSLVAVSVSDASIVLGSQAHRNGPLDLYSYDSPAPVLRCIAGFGLGLLSYRLRDNSVVRYFLGDPGTSYIVCTGVLIMLCIPQSDIAMVILFPALIICLSFQRGLLARILGSKAIFSIGVWSYSIYLLHRPFFTMQDTIAEHLTPFFPISAESIATTATLVVVVALSAIAYRLIENPGRGFMNHLFKRNSSAQRAPIQ